MISSEISQDPPAEDRTKVWYLTTLILVVLASFSTMLLTGHSLDQALLLAGGVTLLGGEITRRIMADAGPVPSIVITCAVTALAVILVVRGYQLSEVAVIAGLAALVAGEVATRIVRSLTTRREV